jgi:hypothetical protein
MPFFFNSHSGRGVQQSPLGTSAIYWPIVPAPGDYVDGEFGGMMIGRGNRNTRRNPAPASICPPQIPHARPGLEPGLPRLEAVHALDRSATATGGLFDYS